MEPNMISKEQLKALQKLSELSLQMEDVLTDLRESDIDVVDIEFNVHQTTALIQDLLDENEENNEDKDNTNND